MSRVMTFGKHPGQTFDWITKNDLKYARWVSTQDWVAEFFDPDIAQQIAEYAGVKLKEFDGVHMPFGKREGESVAWVVTTDPAYAMRLVEQPWATGRLTARIRQLLEEGGYK